MKKEEFIELVALLDSKEIKIKDFIYKLFKVTPSEKTKYVEVLNISYNLYKKYNGRYQTAEEFLTNLK